MKFSKHRLFSTLSTVIVSCALFGLPAIGDNYMQTLQNKLRTAWKPAYESDIQPIVTFKVQADGKATDISLSRSSGNPQLDKQAIQTLKSCSPFTAPPKSATPPIDIQFEFTRR